MELRTPEMQKKSLIMGKAILKLSMYVNSGMLTVNILKARHLFSRYTHDCRPYVQVSLEPDQTGGTQCRTAVSNDAPHPTYNEMFSFVYYSETLPGDGKKRIHISVWNQNGPGKIAEFLGAMSFGLHHMLSKNKENSGWFYLLKEDVGKRKHLPALMRSAVYEEFGPVSPVPTHRDIHTVTADIHDDPSRTPTPITPRRFYQPLHHIDMRSHPQTDNDYITPTPPSPHKPPQIISSPKQVRFSIGHTIQTAEKVPLTYNSFPAADSSSNDVGRTSQQNSNFDYNYNRNTFPPPPPQPHSYNQQQINFSNTNQQNSGYTNTQLPGAANSYNTSQFPHSSDSSAPSYPASQNPFILSYRREISAITNRKSQQHKPLTDISAANSSILTGNSSLLQNSSGDLYGNPRLSTLHENRILGGEAPPTFSSTTEYPLPPPKPHKAFQMSNLRSKSASSFHNTSCEYVQFDPVELSPLTAKAHHQSLENIHQNSSFEPNFATQSSHEKVQETSFIVDKEVNDVSNRLNSVNLQKHQLEQQQKAGNDIWIDCKEKTGLLETEHDSGICDSLSPSPKSENLACCSSCCYKQQRGKYKELVDSSITSDEQLQRVHNGYEPPHRHSKDCVLFKQTANSSMEDNSVNNNINKAPHGNMGNNIRSYENFENQQSNHHGNYEQEPVEYGQYFDKHSHRHHSREENEYIDMKGYRRNMQMRFNEDDEYSHIADFGQSDFSAFDNTDAFENCDYHGHYVNHRQLANHSQQDIDLNFKKYSKQLLRHSMKDDSSVHTKIYFL